jgi:hypothetical protein
MARTYAIRGLRCEMRLAIGFNSFREDQLKIDTIPKPLGLGSRGPREARSVRCTFIEYSMNIRCLFNICSMQIESPYVGAIRVSSGVAHGQ